MAAKDRQQARLRKLALSHLTIASNYLDQAKVSIKIGMGQIALRHLQKALDSIQSTYDVIPMADVPPQELSHLMKTREPAPREPESEPEPAA